MKRIFIYLFFLTFVFLQCNTIKSFKGNTTNFTKRKIKSTVTTLQIKVKKHKKYAELTSPMIYPATISGTIQEKNGDLIFDIESIYFLANWPNGWTEGLFEASGRLIFEKEEDVYKCDVIDSFSMWEIYKGGIRYHDTFYLDEKGMEKVQQRMKRIQGLTSFLHEQSIPDYFGHTWFNSKIGESFNKKVKPILLNKNTRFPEYLQALQSSNTIIRDYTEAIDLFFMDYNLPAYFESILPGSIFR